MRRSLLPALLAPVFLFALLGPAPTASAQQDAEVAAATPVDDLLQTLSLERRIAQLIVCWSLSRDARSPRIAELSELVAEPGIGGVILSLGDATTASTILEQFQARAALPLLCAADFENGPGSHLRGTTDLGEQMLWGAAGSSALVEAAAVVTAREASELGFQQVYAPVLDVNSDPRNPVIAVRSFGEDPAQVARLGAAYVRAAEAAGLLTTAKHFPGHGNVATDSHVALPVVPGDRARLDAVELAPFRAAIDAGLSAIMTGHLAVPGLGLEPGVPATLAPQVLTALLRDDLGFDGLVVTDALDMGALFEGEAPEDPAVRALRAGADVLLMPRDPAATVAAVAAAVRAGRLDPARVDAACRRVLSAKQRAGLLDDSSDSPGGPRRLVGSAAHLAVAREIARRGITLVRDPLGLVPLAAGAPVLLVTLAAQDDPAIGEPVARALRARGHEVSVHRLHPGSEAAAVQSCLDGLAATPADPARIVLSLIDDRVERMPQDLRGSQLLQPVFAALDGASQHVQVALGIPYGVRTLSPQASLICTYHRTGVIERALAAALVGTGPVSGRLPVTLPDQASLAAGVTRLPPDPGPLPTVDPHLEGFAADLADRVRSVLAAGRAQGAAPGAVAQIARRGRVIATVAVGTETWADDAPAITADSLWDLASLTKVCATTPVALRLIDRGLLSLDSRAQELVPGFAGPGKDAVTIRHLLTHTAGLPPFRRLFLEHSGPYAMLTAALAVELQSTPGERYAYSDLGMMLLMLCCERAGGLPFAQLCAREVFAPLGMRHATFAAGAAPLDAVPTEVCAWRGELVRGRVHDENAFAVGGISGHAGLFATAGDVTRLAQAYLGGGRGWLSPTLAAQATRPANPDGWTDTPRGLGWGLYPDGLYADAEDADRGGLSPHSYGHTGYTGTSVWCDPERDLSIVLLTNRVHPTRDNRGHLALRRQLAGTVRAALVDDLPGAR